MLNFFQNLKTTIRLIVNKILHRKYKKIALACLFTN